MHKAGIRSVENDLWWILREAKEITKIGDVLHIDICAAYNRDSLSCPIDSWVCVPQRENVVDCRKIVRSQRMARSRTTRDAVEAVACKLRPRGRETSCTHG